MQALPYWVTWFSILMFSIPILIISVIFLIKTIWSIYNEIELKRVKDIETMPEDFEPVIFEKVKPDYILPRGQFALRKYEVRKAIKGTKQRNYDGGTFSNLKLPFVRFSSQHKRLWDGSSFIDYGKSNITLTNKIIHIQSEKVRWRYNIKDIDQILPVLDGNTIQLSWKSGKSAWPVRIKFKTKLDKEDFILSYWTIRENRY